MPFVRTAAIATLALVALGGGAHAQSLRGSPASMDRQNAAAAEARLDDAATVSDAREKIDEGEMVRLGGSRNYAVASASFAYARPVVRTFLERVGAGYRSACGEVLVVTSALRPWSLQPANGSERSVHPDGIAVDLRVSRRSPCRRWLERRLLTLEGRGVIEATHEHHPAHYHVAVFPVEYGRYARAARSDDSDRTRAKVAQARPTGKGRVALARNEGGARTAKVHQAIEETRYATVRVRKGDTLSAIAKRRGVTVRQILAFNGLRKADLKAGQRIRIPEGRSRG